MQLNERLDDGCYSYAFHNLFIDMNVKVSNDIKLKLDTWLIT